MVLCRHCAKAIAARTLKATKGEASCGAQRAAVGFFKQENPVSQNVVNIDLGHLRMPTSAE